MNFKKIPTAATAAAAAASPDHSADAFVPRSLLNPSAPPLSSSSPLVSLGVFSDLVWEERGLSKPPLSVTDFKTQGPRPSVSPNHHISEAPAESLVHWRRNIWSVLFARINSHTNDRSAPALREKGRRGEGGRGSGRAAVAGEVRRVS